MQISVLTNVKDPLKTYITYTFKTIKWQQLFFV